MNTWSSHSRMAINSIFDKITVHPFISELMNGTLPETTFEFYIQQDALYLADFGKILAGIASKLHNPADIQAYLGFATGTIVVEEALHEMFLNLFKTEGKVVEKSPTCLLYTGFLHEQLTTQPIEVALAAVLPCFWIYKEVGDYILANQTTKENPYQSWIDTYGGEDFAASVTKAIAITDVMAMNTTPAIQQKMTRAFVKASQLEWMFWDSAYTQESWKI